jgi:hypothetical protein
MAAPLYQKTGDTMKKLFLMLTLSMIWLTSCARPYYTKLENPNVTFERPGYSLSVPAGGEWRYHEDDASMRYNLTFFKRLPDDPDFHSRAVGVIETPTTVLFESPQEFENWTKRTIEMAMNPNRLRLLDKKFELDGKFGPLTLRYFTRAEDSRAANKGNEPFLLMEDYGCIFVHPKNPNLIVQVSYSERGKAGQIGKDLRESAEAFLDGIKIK